MAYTIHRLNFEPGQSPIGEMVSSGQTRQQTISALQSLGFLDYGQDIDGQLPRFGKAVIIANPKYKQSFVIAHR